jgi:hypothetical protein
MKWSFKIITVTVLLFLFNSKTGNSQPDTLVVNAKFVSPDGIGNLFVVTENNTLLKVDSDLKVLISQSLISYGIASSIECRGATEVIVYSYSTGQLVVFDNFLKEKNRFDLTQLIIPKPNIICISKTGWWCFDETSSTITNYTGSFVKSYSLPEIINPEKEIRKMAEIEFTYPNILYADNSFTIPIVKYGRQHYGFDYEYLFRTMPVINYNTQQIFGYSHDSLVCLSLDKTKKRNYTVTITHLKFTDVKTVTKSFNTYFFIQPNAILAVREPEI